MDNATGSSFHIYNTRSNYADSTTTRLLAASTLFNTVAVSIFAVEKLAGGATPGLNVAKIFCFGLGFVTLSTATLISNCCCTCGEKSYDYEPLSSKNQRINSIYANEPTSTTSTEYDKLSSTGSDSANSTQLVIRNVNQYY